VHPRSEDGDKVWEQIEAAAREIHDDIEVWFCGHSLGGVVAKLLHHRYRFEGRRFPGLVKVRVVVLLLTLGGA
jgi:alpha-beta hydrolase superfamily lysophospholipase